jgi:hypothetical protein
VLAAQLVLLGIGHVTMSARLLILAALGLALLLGGISAFAQQRPTADEQRIFEEHKARENKQNFTGWEGILFYCPDRDQSNKALKEICDKTYSNAAFLAAAAKLNLVKAHDGYELGFMAIADDLLVFEVELYSTKPGTPAAVHANLRAYISYSKAIDTSSLAQEKKGARTIPRSGDLLFWERGVIGASSGTAQELVLPISQGIEQHLKQFFADFVNAQR